MFFCIDYVSCFWTPSPKELLISFISRRQTRGMVGRIRLRGRNRGGMKKGPEFVPSQFMYWPRAKVFPFEAVWVLDCENDNFCFKMLYFSLWPHLPVWWGQEPHSVLLITYDHQNVSQCSHKSASNASENSSSETSRTSFAWPLLGLKPYSLLRSHGYFTLETHVIDLWKSTLTCLSSRVTPLRLL